MQERWQVDVIAILVIGIIQVTNLLTTQIDGMVASSIIGAIVFIATRQFYKSNNNGNPWRKTLK